MIPKTIWERHLLRETLKVFFLFLGCFFLLYALIDYSLHMRDFVADKRIQLSHIGTYYFFQFVKRADLLIPLALLIATLKVLFGMNASGELIALQASGLSARTILRPLFFVGALCTAFNLISAEFLLPSSLNHLDNFRVKHFKHARHSNQKEPVHVLPLKDRSKIVYQIEDKEKGLYLDVFWIRSTDEMWRMHSLQNDPVNPVGYFVDHLKRNAQGNFEKLESFAEYRFEKFRWQADPTGKGYIPLENRKVSELFRLISKKNTSTAYEYPQALTHLLFKITTAFFSFLVVIAGAPFCLRHSRNLPVFATYAIALFGFVTFFALMDAAVILGENLVYSPYASILGPLLVCWGGFSFNYKKMVS